MWSRDAGRTAKDMKHQGVQAEKCKQQKQQNTNTLIQHCTQKKQGSSLFLEHVRPKSLTDTKPGYTEM